MLRGPSTSSAASSSSAASASTAAAEKTARLRALQQRLRSATADTVVVPLEHRSRDTEDIDEDAIQTDGKDRALSMATGSPVQASLDRRSARQTGKEAESSNTLHAAATAASIAGSASSSSLSSSEKPAVPVRAFEELQLKLRLLESGRSTDRARLIELERLKEDWDSYALARPKLQAKLVELAGEVKELRRQVKYAAAEREELDRKVEDAEEKMEMEALDKEMAEEKLEQEMAKLDAAKERVAELEVELEVIRKDEGEPSRGDASQGLTDCQCATTVRIVSEARGDLSGGEGTGQEGVKDSLIFIQLAKQNERLKEALMRLRDLSNENEQENKRRISDLEKELDLTADMQGTLPLFSYPRGRFSLTRPDSHIRRDGRAARAGRGNG